jgi:hypothetical protein
MMTVASNKKHIHRRTHIYYYLYKASSIKAFKKISNHTNKTIIKIIVVKNKT